MKTMALVASLVFLTIISAPAQSFYVARHGASDNQVTSDQANLILIEQERTTAALQALLAQQKKDAEAAKWAEASRASQARADANRAEADAISQRVSVLREAREAKQAAARELAKKQEPASWHK